MKKIEEILANVDDAEKVEKIVQLLGTVAYYEVSPYEGAQFHMTSKAKNGFFRPAR